MSDLSGNACSKASLQQQMVPDDVEAFTVIDCNNDYRPTSNEVAEHSIEHRFNTMFCASIFSETKLSWIKEFIVFESFHYMFSDDLFEQFGYS